jgi:hypothetical protein
MRHDTQHNDIQYDGTKRNRIICFYLCRSLTYYGVIMFGVIILNVVMLNVNMLRAFMVAVFMLRH